MASSVKYLSAVLLLGALCVHMSDAACAPDDWRCKLEENRWTYGTTSPGSTTVGNGQGNTGTGNGQGNTGDNNGNNNGGDNNGNNNTGSGNGNCNGNTVPVPGCPPIPTCWTWACIQALRRR